MQAPFGYLDYKEFSMRNVFSIGLLCLGFALTDLTPAQAQNAEKTFQMRNRFEAGKTIYLDMANTSKGTIVTKTKDAPAKNPINSLLKTVISYKTLTVDQNQSADIEIGFDQLIQSGETLGNATRDLSESLGLKDRTIQFRIDPLGNIQEKSEQSQGKLDHSLTSYTRQSPYLKLPEQAVPIGFSWNESRQIPFSSAAKPLIAHTTYTLDSVVEEDGQTIAVIKTDSSVHETDIPVDSSAKNGKNVNVVIKYVFKEYSIAGKGEIRFSVSKGRVLSTHDQQQVRISMQGSTDVDKSSFEQDVKQEFSQETKAVFSETSPLPQPEPAKAEPPTQEPPKPE